MSWLEILGVITNVLGVWLTIRRNMLCWPIGIIGAFVYCYQFLLWRLYSDTGLQFFYAITLFYGWWAWRRDSRKAVATALLVQPANRRWFIWEGLMTVLASYVLGLVLWAYTDDPLPWADGGLTCFSLLASLWAARRHWENWALWIVVDALYSGMFLRRHEWLTAGLYVMFTVLAVYGVRRWRHELRASDGVSAQG